MKHYRASALLGVIVLGLLTFGCKFFPSAAASAPCLSWSGQCIFPGSIDTMKLSRDMELNGLTDAQIANAVAVAAQQNPTHITVDTHYDYPDVMYKWIKAIRAQGRKVWFRDGIKGWGSGTITPSQWLQTYQNWLNTYVGNPNYLDFFEKGDIFDPNAESENGYVAYCQCSLGGGTSWTTAFNQFLIDQTTIADQVFSAKGFNQNPSGRDILTTVHSVDPGTAVGALNSSFMSAMNNLVTVDAYPDRNDTDPTAAANDWLRQLGSIYSAWPRASILIGEMGYSNTINVDDSQQRTVIAAEMQAFSTTTYRLVGINYWVGPGSATAGGYTYLLAGSVSTGWSPRPAAACLSAFFSEKEGGSLPLCSSAVSPTSTPTVTPSSVGGIAEVPDVRTSPAATSGEHQHHTWLWLMTVFTVAVLAAGAGWYAWRHPLK